MHLTRLGGECRNGTCPTIYSTDRGTYVIQGYAVSDEGALEQLDLPLGEAAVEIPRDLIASIANDL
ncbi:hypothetical protein GCM10022205_10870 [Spinactinospora alkalitolerans]